MLVVEGLCRTASRDVEGNERGEPDAKKAITGGLTRRLNGMRRRRITERRQWSVLNISKTPLSEPSGGCSLWPVQDLMGIGSLGQSAV